MKPRNCLLLVEDDLALGETLSEGLDDAGFDVVAASNGAEALAELDADSSQFEEVITDIDLGTGPNGWDVGRHARECVADMPVLYMSGASGRDWPSKGVANSAFIAKPFSIGQMIHAHDVALAESGKIQGIKQVPVPPTLGQKPQSDPPSREIAAGRGIAAAK